MNFTFNLGDNNRNRDYEVNKNIKVNPIVGIIFGAIIIIAGIFLTIFLYNYGKELKEKDKTYIETIATVIDNRHSTTRDDDDGTYRDVYTPVFEYEVNGVKYKGETNTESSFEESIGKEIHIKYNPDKPSDYILTSDANFGSMYFLLGIVIIVAGIIVVIVNVGKVGQPVEQIKEFTDQLYDNDVDRLYGNPAEINSTITHPNDNNGNNTL